MPSTSDLNLLHLADYVAKGKQDNAKALIEAIKDKQSLLKTPTKLTDYSGRTFYCTVYEYAYWALDKHMCCMLKKFMDDNTKEFFKDKTNIIETTGLSYRKVDKTYKNPHYDMSYSLKDLSESEFNELKKMVSDDFVKIKNLTIHNYQNIAFSADEYQALKNAIKPHLNWWGNTYFYKTKANIINSKLSFDFDSLITALDTYVKKYNPYYIYQNKALWKKVGMAQRQVPAHIAQEYCRPDRAFYPKPSFTEHSLPRGLSFRKGHFFDSEGYWFPLPLSSTGLGFDYGLIRANFPSQCEKGYFLTENEAFSWPHQDDARKDLEAVSHLIQVRTADVAMLNNIEKLNVDKISLRSKSQTYGYNSNNQLKL